MEEMEANCEQLNMSQKRLAKHFLLLSYGIIKQWLGEWRIARSSGLFASSTASPLVVYSPGAEPAIKPFRFAVSNKFKSYLDVRTREGLTPASSEIIPWWSLALPCILHPNLLARVESFEARGSTPSAFNIRLSGSSGPTTFLVKRQTSWTIRQKLLIIFRWNSQRTQQQTPHWQI